MIEIKPYIMTWRGGDNADVDPETRIVIHGPFSAEKEAVKWGNANTDDDPRWQLVMLSDEWIEDRGDKFLIVPILLPDTESRP